MRETRKHIRYVLESYPEAVRMQADSNEQHIEAHKWIERLHGVKEAVIPLYGRDGATYYRYRWIKSEVAFERFIEGAA